MVARDRLNSVLDKLGKGAPVAVPDSDSAQDVLTGLAEVPLALFKGAEAIESGKGENALGGPIEVLAHLVSLLSEADQLQGGELVTTGTLTDAWPVSPGEEWSAGFGGVMDTELSVRFT